MQGMQPYIMQVVKSWVKNLNDRIKDRKSKKKQHFCAHIFRQVKLIICFVLWYVDMNQDDKNISW